MNKVSNWPMFTSTIPVGEVVVVIIIIFQNRVLIAHSSCLSGLKRHFTGIKINGVQNFLALIVLFPVDGYILSFRYHCLLSAPSLWTNVPSPEENLELSRIVTVPVFSQILFYPLACLLSTQHMSIQCRSFSSTLAFSKLNVRCFLIYQYSY